MLKRDKQSAKKREFFVYRLRKLFLVEIFYLSPRYVLIVGVRGMLRSSMTSLSLGCLMAGVTYSRVELLPCEQGNTRGVRAVTGFGNKFMYLPVHATASGNHLSEGIGRGSSPSAKGECPMATIPPPSTPTESELQEQDPRAEGSASPTTPRGVRRCVWVVALGLVAMIMSTFLVLQSGKMFNRMFPPSAPDEFNRSGVSAVVLHEWQNARADHEAIAVAVAQCFDWGDAYVYPGFLNKQLMLDMGPNGDRLRYTKTQEEAHIKSLK